MRQKVSGLLVLLAVLPFLHGHIAGKPAPQNLKIAENRRADLAKEKIQWMSLAEATSKQTLEQKPILIDLYTDWCGWCKVMDKKTYAQADVAAYIMKNFYPVKLDAEAKAQLIWKGKTYTYNSGSRIHDFAIFLTEGQLSFPQTVFMIPGEVRPQAIPGYLEVQDMELLLRYFGEGHYGRTAFEDFQKKFSPSWK